MEHTPMRASRIAVLTLAVASSAFAQPAVLQKFRGDYERLQRWRYAAIAISITQPIVIRRDTATWTLESGAVRLSEPTADGRVTGLVFEGQGRFVMTVPDPVELAQLRRFTRRSNLQSIDEPFTQMLFRTSDESLNAQFGGASKGEFSANGIAERLQNHWLIDLRSDVDAKIIAALADPGALQITAGFKTADFDWLTYEYDSSRDEEVTLTRWYRNYPEGWISLHGAKHSEQKILPRVEHIDVTADLTRSSFFAGTAGATHQQLINGHYSVAETIVPGSDSPQALRLQLLPTAHDVTAMDEDGTALLVLHDHIGARGVTLDKRLYDSFLTLIFPRPLESGKPRRITFQYDLELSNYAPGNEWYPSFPGFHDRITARLELLVSRRNEVRAMGTRQSETATDKGTRSVWIVDRPTKMVTFSTAEHFEEVPIEIAGVPKVISFGSTAGFGTAARIRNAAADTVNSLQFYQWLLEDKLDVPQIYVTSITGGHGQAFDGFLHLSEFSYDEHPGATELFRAHEVAHEWFGHKIGWKSYRDQWLSESFADYAALMFVQATVRGGAGLFNEALEAYDGIVKGNMSGGFSKFNRPFLVVFNRDYRDRLGPISFGIRASTGDIPFGYLIQSYYKGPLVLHMLRTLLFAKTHSDDLFKKILQDYVHQFSGKDASTADFQRVVEHDAPGDWSFFFHAWVDSAEIPDCTWSDRVEPVANGFKVTVAARLRNVPADFTAVAPIRIDLDGGRLGFIFLRLDSEERTVSTTVPSKPRDVIFAPDHSLLANIRRE